VNWSPNDLVSDLDLRDYEAAILDDFGQTHFAPKRQRALEDWLLPILKSQGLDPLKLRTRFQPEKLFSYTSLAYTDRTDAARNATADDLDLAAIFASAGTDCLYLGSTEPFRGAFFRLLDSVSSAASILTVAYWNGSWQPLAITDGTQQISGKTFGQGGSVTWVLPADWVVRPVSTSALLYWVKVSVSATPTSAKAGTISVIRASALRAPATYRTLQLIFQEAPTSLDGPWLEKAAFYKAEADAALQRALAICGGEFDTDDSDDVDADEAAQTVEEAGGGWTLERA
jgi:hypothetical protein